jgi:hypothetical protein
MSTLKTPRRVFGAKGPVEAASALCPSPASRLMAAEFLPSRWVAARFITSETFEMVVTRLPE